MKTKLEFIFMLKKQNDRWFSYTRRNRLVIGILKL